MADLSPEFVSFLRAAKRATYAAQGDEASVLPLLPDSKQLEYARDHFHYRDIYVGMLRFVGQEIIYWNGRAMWSMSYSGGMLPEVARSEAVGIYRLVRSALSAAPVEMPIRGPQSFEADGMSYTCVLHGDLQRFHGAESIARDHQQLYELQFSGGGLG